MTLAFTKTIINRLFVLTGLLGTSFAFSEPHYPKIPHTLLLDITTHTSALTAYPRVVAVGQRGHIIISTDGGFHFKQSPNATPNTLTSVSFLTDRIALAVGHHLTILRSEDGGKNWEKVAHDITDAAPFLDILPLTPTIALAVGAYGYVARTDDAGKTWQISLPTQEDFHLNTIIARNENQLLIAGESGSVYRSNDQGLHWTRLETPYSGSFFGGLFLPDQRVLLLGLRGNAVLGDPFNDNATWQNIELGTEQTWFDVTQDNNGDVWMTGAAGQLQRVDASYLLASASSHTLTPHIHPHHREDRQDIAALAINGSTLWTVGETGMHSYELPVKAPAHTELVKLPFHFMSDKRSR